MWSFSSSGFHLRGVQGGGGGAEVRHANADSAYPFCVTKC